MSEPIAREAKVNRDGEGVSGVSIFLGPDALDKLDINATVLNSIHYTVADGELELSAGELRPPQELPERDEDQKLLSLDDAPKELRKKKVRERYPDELPDDFGAYWKRQEKRLFAIKGFECEYCGETSPSKLRGSHIHTVEEFGDDELAEAHDITNLQVLCGSCV